MKRPTRHLATVMLSALSIVAAACGSSSEGPSDTTAAVPETSTAAADTTAAPRAGRTVTILAYDSFTPSKEALAELTRQTGIELEIITAGDTGELVNRAILTKGTPLADLVWGVDNTFLTRALQAGIFEPYRSPELDRVDARFRSIAPEDVTPVDYGDVCVNADTEALQARGLPLPTTYEDLADPRYRDLLVVQDPARSSPGLAFLLGTVAELGEPGWTSLWERLRDNGVKVVSSWDVAWNTEFSGGPGKGSRPLVVSYASSPPAVVLFGPDPAATTSPVVALPETCFRQVEFAGILRGTRRLDDARAVIDFLLGETFQADLPLNLFVFPVRSGVTLPEAFTRFAVSPERPRELDAGRIAANRDRWIDEWTSILG